MNVGDFSLGKTFDFKFTTIDSSGAPITLGNTPVLAAYPDNTTTEITAGLTITVDFDGRTGLHNVRVVATSGNGYATATNYALILTAGTVNGTSVVGYVVGHFSIENRSALRPTTPDVTVDVAATGEVGLDFNNIKDASGSHTLTNIRIPNVTLADTVTTLTNLPSIPANWLTAAGINAGALNGKGDWLLASSYTAPPTVAAIATGVWQDSTAGDFTVASSIGKALYINNVVPGAAGGHFIAGTNAATVITGSLTTTFTGNLTGSVNSVTTGVTLAASQHVIVDSGTVTTLTNLPAITAGWLTANGIADGAIDRATFAADTGLQTIRSGTAQGGGGAGIILDAGASAVDDFYQDCIVLTTGGTGAGQARTIISYTGVDRTAAVRNWATPPDSSTTFAILPHSYVDLATIQGGDALTQIENAAWDGPIGDHLIFGTVGYILNSLSTRFGVPAISLSDDIAGVPDALLGRNIKGGSSTGRKVSEALAASRNKVIFDVPGAGQFTVMDTDDVTPLWVGTYTRGANTLGPLTAVDPT